MTDFSYDPDNALLTMKRQIAAYVQAQFDALMQFDGTSLKVEMSFPDTRNWTKLTPLDKVIVHFEQDDIANPALGFGIPGVDVPTTDDDGNLFSARHEAAQHLVNFDVGVWVSTESGGDTMRSKAVQTLLDIFTTATGKQAFNEATGGLWIVSFSGGRNELDRINDIPLWRALGMTLIVRVFSRHIPATPDVVALDFDQDDNLTISSGGSSIAVETP